MFIHICIYLHIHTFIIVCFNKCFFLTCTCAHWMYIVYIFGVYFLDEDQQCLWELCIVARASAALKHYYIFTCMFMEMCLCVHYLQIHIYVLFVVAWANAVLQHNSVFTRMFMEMFSCVNYFQICVYVLYVVARANAALKHNCIFTCMFMEKCLCVN